MPKTITDIIPPSRRRKTIDAIQPATPAPLPPAAPKEEHGDDGTPTGYPRPLRAYRKRFPVKYALAALVTVIIGGVMLHSFGGTKVEIIPTKSEISVSGEFAATASGGDLPYERIVATSVVSASVPAEGTEEAEDPAQGSITVYNAQGKPQQLIKNTRFESPQGLIFRIRDSITVPAGSATAPGELAVTVYADQGGEEYNIGPTTFTVPGLKGSETFDLVYARSSSAMTGGFSGMRASVSDATRNSRYETMKGAIDAELADALRAEVKEGYVLLPGASWTTYEPQPDGVASGTVTLNQKGTATAVVFPNEALAKAVASRAGIEEYEGQPVTISDLGTLALASMSGAPPALGDASFSFSLSGKTEIKWRIDKEKIAAALAGKKRSAADTVLTGYPEVDKALIVLRPFWAGKLPDNPEKIQVTIEGQEE